MNRIVLTALILSAALPGLAQEVTILDLNTDGIPTNPYTILEAHAPTLGGRLVFSAGSDDGTELWFSDGTAAGTTLVADINPGSQRSDPRDLLAARGLVFFTADDGATGGELWRSDGTAAGTVLVGDMFSGPDDSDAKPIAELAGGLVLKPIFIRHLSDHHHPESSPVSNPSANTRLDSTDPAS